LLERRKVVQEKLEGEADSLADLAAGRFTPSE
jgi:hypothetical protein